MVTKDIGKKLISYGSTYQGQTFEPWIIVLVCI